MWVAVHGGAGVHPSDTLSVKTIKKALSRACTRALEAQTALQGVTRAICELEDDPVFNAGVGSSLTLLGTVECDAGVMTSDGSFGSVGALSGVSNPILGAKAVWEYGRKPDRLGRIPPMMLVGSGARSFCPKSIRVDPERMVTDRAREEWTKWTGRLEGEESLHDIQDTVGAVVMMNDSSCASGVSR